MSRSLTLNYLILLRENEDTRRIDEVEVKGNQPVIGLLEVIYKRHHVLFSSRCIDSIDLILYRPMENFPIERSGLLERERSAEMEELKDNRTIQDAFGTGQLDPNMIHLVVKAQVSATAARQAREVLGDQDIPHREQVTFRIRFSEDKPDLLSAYNCLGLQFIDTTMRLSDEVATRVDALRRILGQKRGAPEGGEEATEHVLLRCFQIDNTYTEIVRNLMSGEGGARPYAYWYLEIVHYVLALAHVLARNKDPTGVDAFPLQWARSVVCDRFLEYWLIKIKGECMLGQNFPFPLVAQEVDGSGERLKYHPQPDVVFLMNKLPRFLAEMDSQSDGGDKYQLLVEMTCVLRLACALGAEKDKFFLMGVFFSKDRIAYRYIVFYGEEKIQCLEDWFRMDNASRLITFLFEFYNYADYVGDDKTSYRESIEKMSSAIQKGVIRSLYTKGQSSKHAPGTSNRSALIDVLQKSGYAVQSYPEGFEPLTELPDNIMKATTRNGKAVIAKLSRKNSAETRLLHELLSYESPHNHVIPLLGVVQSSLGPVIILPLATSLSPDRTSGLFQKELRGECVRLGRELVEGVAFLHRHRIAHLDIKPDNLVYSFESERLYIIDFDIAVQCTDADETVLMSCGTPGWSAPEIVHDENEPLRAFSPIRADLWSCGKTLQHFAEASKEEDSDLTQLSDCLLDDDPRRRPLLHEVVDEEPDFWTSRRLLQALSSQKYGGKVPETTLESGARSKRARDDAEYVGGGGLAPKALRIDQ